MINSKPNIAEESVHLAERTSIELDEFIACLEFDREAPGVPLRVVVPILDSLKDLRSSMADGKYVIEPFIEVARKLDTPLPFSHMLAVTKPTATASTFKARP